MTKILVTGAAGFIGAALCKKLLIENKDVEIVGVDSMNTYYNVELKRFRVGDILRARERESSFQFYMHSICDKKFMEELFREERFDVVVNLAAQAGVRYSIKHPDTYIENNIVGFFNVLECCRRFGVGHFIYASSSSVYGKNRSYPYMESDRTDCPVSLYAATKKADEVMAHAYSELYGLMTTGLRFFTVYGPMGRPDMACWKFTNSILSGEEITLYGACGRDFTYIGDITEGISRIVMGKTIQREKYMIYNIGCGQPVSVYHFVSTLYDKLMRAGVLDEYSRLRFTCAEMQPGDVEKTYADSRALERDYGYKPMCGLGEGLKKWSEWVGGEGGMWFL